MLLGPRYIHTASKLAHWVTRVEFPKGLCSFMSDYTILILRKEKNMKSISKRKLYQSEHVSSGEERRAHKPEDPGLY